MRLDEKVAQTGDQGPIHALIIGDTKTGKSDWVVQAILDGYQCIYIDADNGLETLLYNLRGKPEALRRVVYFNPTHIADFVVSLLTEQILRYNLRTNNVGIGGAVPSDEFVTIIPSKIPRGLIVSIDSWTSLTLDIIQTKADNQDIDLLDADKYTREIYGGTGFKATQILKGLQSVSFHLIVQGHGGYYERKEKPADQVAKAVTEKEMVIRETKEVPISTSMPHGATIGKFFNQIGWLVIDRANNRKLDFRAMHGRVGGGTPAGIEDPRGAYRFSKLFGKPPEYPDQSEWYSTTTFEAIVAQNQSRMSNMMAPKKAPPVTPTAVTTPGIPVATKPKLPGFKPTGTAVVIESTETNNGTAEATADDAGSHPGVT